MAGKPLFIKQYMSHSTFAQLFNKVLNRSASAQEKEQLQQLWNKDVAEELLPYHEWEQTTATGTVPDNLTQQVLLSVVATMPRGVPGSAAPEQSVVVPMPRKRMIHAAWWSAAAVLLPAIAGIWWVQRSSNNVKVLPEQVIAAAWGEKKRITLPDGSVVHLNGGSTLHIPGRFALNTRGLQLQGEAFFEVALNHAHPFVVHTGNTATTVLGTSFNIAENSRQNSIAVAVRTGKVKVALGSKQAVLLPGMQAVALKNNPQLAISRVTEASAGGWTENNLVFDNVSLDEICLALKRKYGVEFMPGNPALMQCRFSVSFNRLTLQQSLHKLALLGRMQFVYKENKVAIKGVPCKP
jgi:ferric-dicitrate binding protein FerR (iron transport regulator)